MADTAKPQDASSQPAPEKTQTLHLLKDSKRTGLLTDGKVTRPDVVVFKNVTKVFGHGPEAKVAIQDISFVVEDLPDIGELVTIVGPSGCGKSTILRTIASLKPHFPPTQGEVLVFGKPAPEPGPDRGLVDQRYSLLPHLSVLENVAFG